MGELPALLPPATISGIDPRMDPIPAIGEHTESILGEIGLSTGEIAALHADGAISFERRSGNEDGK
ncbi:Formyl-CoA:oxalate CoA-transferase [compost metagenome]